MVRYTTVLRDNTVVLYGDILVHRSGNRIATVHGRITGHFNDITARISAYNNTERMRTRIRPVLFVLGGDNRSIPYETRSKQQERMSEDRQCRLKPTCQEQRRMARASYLSRRKQRSLEFSHSDENKLISIHIANPVLQCHLSRSLTRQSFHCSSFAREVPMFFSLAYGLVLRFSR